MHFNKINIIHTFIQCNCNVEIYIHYCIATKHEPMNMYNIIIISSRKQDDNKHYNNRPVTI